MKYACLLPLLAHGRSGRRWKQGEDTEREAGQNNTGHKGEMKIVKETNDLWFVFFSATRILGFSGEVH